MTETPWLLIVMLNFALGLGAGFILHRSDYCLAGMFRDVFLFRQTFMLRTLFLLVVLSTLLTELARLGGLLAIYPFVWQGAPTLVNLLGGAVFGLGMVLAGGCVVGTLYKMGSGSLLSAIAFVGLLAGSALYAEFHPAWKALATATTLFPGKITLSQIFGVSPTVPAVIVVLFGGWLLYRWARRGELSRFNPSEGYLQPWKAAVGLSVLGLLSCMAMGFPIGITTVYAKIGGAVEGLFFPGHVSALPYFQATLLDYVPPIAPSPLRGGAAPTFDAVAAIQLPIISGITLGAAASAMLLREFRIHLRIPLRQAFSALLGGVIMGLGARMAMGCNVWFLMGGLPIMTGASLLFLLGLFPGAWLGSVLLTRVFLRV